MSTVIAIKPFEETRVAWSHISDHAATVTATIKRLIAGELAGDDLATPESYVPQPGTGFDKARNPNWFKGLYGKALSRSGISARIPGDLWDSLQSINNWQDTLRKALHKLVESIVPTSEPEVDPADAALEERVRAYISTPRFEDMPSYKSFLTVDGEEFIKSMARIKLLGVDPKQTSETILNNMQAKFSMYRVNNTTGWHKFDEVLKIWTHTVKNRQPLDETPANFELANHLVRGLRKVRTEANEWLGV